MWVSQRPAGVIVGRVGVAVIAVGVGECRVGGAGERGGRAQQAPQAVVAEGGAVAASIDAGQQVTGRVEFGVLMVPRSGLFSWLVLSSPLVL